MQTQPIQKILVGLILPAAILGASILVFVVLGQSTPRQIADSSSDLVAALKRLPIVEIDQVLPYDTSQTLDVEVNGVVVPLREVTVAAEVAGRITEKSENCRAGNYVEANELLFRIDDKDYRLEVERLSAQRESEYSQQRELEQEISNSARLIKVAEEDLELQSREIERLLDLPKGFASATELDTARRNKLTSLNALTTLQNQLELLRSRRTRIELSEKLAATQLEQARVNLARTEIRAPISGVIVSEEVQTDSFVQRGATLCVMEDTDQAEVRCDLRTDQLSAILDQENYSNIGERNSVSGAPAIETRRISQSYELPPTPVTIVYQIAGREDLQYEWDGVLSRYEGVGVDVQSRTISVRVLVDDPRKVRVVNNSPRAGATEPSSRLVPALLRGMFVRAVFRTKPSQAMVLIPKLGVRPGGVVWKFEADPTALELPPKTESTAPGGETAGAEVPRDGKFVSAKSADESKSTVDGEATEIAQEGQTPAVIEVADQDWGVGRVQVLQGIRTVRVIDVESPNQPSVNREYWVAQADERLKVGSFVITTPLAAIMGDGSDLVRVEQDE